MNLYVGNLAYGVTEDQLRETFAAFGEVASVKLITDRLSGESKGFAFVEMPSNRDADVAIKSLNGSPLQGRIVKVNQAQAKGKKAPRGRSRH